MMRYLQLRSAVNLLKQFQHTSSSSPLAVSVTSTLSSGVSEKIDANKLSESSEKEGTSEKSDSKQQPVRSTLVASVFASLKSAEKEGKDIADTFSEQIGAAKSVEDLLSVVESTKVSRKHALKIVTVLADWTCAGRIQASDFESDPRFLVLCRVLGRLKSSGKIETATPPPSKVSSSDLATVLGITGDDEAAKLVGKISLPQMIKVMSSLAAKKRRSLLLLRSLAFNISASSDKVDIKEGADVLYASALLNFYDEVLLEKVCSDLYDCILKNKKRAVVGSITTSLGILKYRDTELLDTLSEWYMQHLEVCQTQDIVSLLMTLATVYYIPGNADTLFTKLNSHMGSTDMGPSQWLDTVWALTILDRATPEHYASVLGEKFLNHLTGFDIDDMSMATKLKLLNINGAARLKAKEDYKGPLLDTNADPWKVQLSRTKEKQTLVTSVLEAMSNLLPSSQYIKTNIDTGMGFLIDAEFLVDNKLTPMPLVDKKTGAPINRSDSRKGIKVAILVLDYHDTTRRSSSMTGVAALSVELSRLSGYKVMAVKHSDFMSHSKLVARVQFLEQQLKLLIQNKT